MKATELKQRRFIEEYHKDGNAYQAALRAGYSDNYARTNAPKLLEIDRNAAYLAELNAKTQKRNILTAQQRQEKLSQIACSDDAADGDKIRAIDVMNKMDGAYIVKVDAAVHESEKLSDIIGQIAGKGLEE